MYTWENRHAGARWGGWALPGAGRQQWSGAWCPTATLCLMVQSRCPNNLVVSTPSQEPAGCFDWHLLCMLWQLSGRANHHWSLLSEEVPSAFVVSGILLRAGMELEVQGSFHGGSWRPCGPFPLGREHDDCSFSLVPQCPPHPPSLWLSMSTEGEHKAVLPTARVAQAVTQLCLPSTSGCLHWQRGERSRHLLVQEWFWREALCVFRSSSHAEVMKSVCFGKSFVLLWWLAAGQLQAAAASLTKHQRILLKSCV